MVTPEPYHDRVDPRWFDAIPVRRSRRRFDERPIDPGLLDRMDAFCRLFRPAPMACRALLLPQALDDIYKGVLGPYGRVQGAPALVAFVARKDALVDTGYLGEAVILEATVTGLDTCWVAGTFDKGAVSTYVDVASGEEVVAVTPLGHAIPAKSRGEKVLRRVVRSDRRKTAGEIASGHEGWPAWAIEAVEAVRMAPSGANGQPWRLRMEDDALVVARSAKAYWTHPFDTGIAMLHAELGALHAGVPGRWERLEDPDVARFTPA